MSLSSLVQAVHERAAAVHPAPRFAGDVGAGVKLMQLCLHRSMGAHSINKANGAYGARTIHDVLHFEIAHRITPYSGRTCGNTTWAALAKHIPHVANGKTLLAAALKEDHPLTRAQGIRKNVVSWAWWLYAHRGLYTYRQYRPYPAHLWDEVAHYRLDCSSSVTLEYKAAGAVDPNGFGYSGWGYTGTMWNRGHAVSSPRPGDSVFYGYMAGGVPSHVAMCVGSGMAISFGSTPVRYVPVYYRRDVRGFRDYVGD